MKDNENVKSKKLIAADKERTKNDGDGNGQDYDPKIPNKIDENQRNTANSMENESKIIKIGNWNLGGIKAEGALKNLVQEIKIYGMEIDIDNYILLRSRSQSGRFGVGFLTGPRVNQEIKNFEEISDRMCILTIKHGTRGRVKGYVL